MAEPETKFVLGRRFTLVLSWWRCSTKHGSLVLRPRRGGTVSFIAELEDSGDDHVIARGEGPTEADAILALQSQLRKMAELEVET